MVDSPTSIVLLGSNRNRIGSMTRGRCRCSCLGMSVRIGVLVSKLTFLTTSISLLFRLHWVLRNLGPLNILISSNRDLEIVGVLNHLKLRGRKSLSS
jgi:hypothetical protein